MYVSSICQKVKQITKAPAPLVVIQPLYKVQKMSASYLIFDSPKELKYRPERAFGTVFGTQRQKRLSLNCLKCSIHLTKDALSA